MKINKIDLANLRNDAQFQFHTEFRDLVTEHGSAALKIKPLFDAYLPLYDREDEALKKIVKSELTAKMHEADKARDDIFRSMKEINSAYLRHFNPLVRDAATRLKIVFDTYGKVADKPLNEETSAIHNILQELKGNRAADATAVCIADWVDELEVRNNAFENLVKQRLSEATAKTDIVLKEARTELDAAYRAIMKRIDAIIELEGAAIYEQFIKTLNILIDNYHTKHHHRHHHASHAQPEGAKNDV